MTYDAIIIGTGQAGPPLAARLASEGLKTAVIEKSHYGGTCVNTGCTPTKAWVASARRAFAVRSAAHLGIRADALQVDMKKIKARKDAIIQDSRDGLSRMLEGTDGLSVYKGHARFIGPKKVEVNGEELEAEKIFINVGARPFIPEGFKGGDYLTNESILQLQEVPEHLLIVGGGYIGLEFAQMFRRFGSKVTLIEMGGRLLQKEDPDICSAIKEILEAEGIDIRLNATCLSGSRKNGTVTVNLDCAEGEPEATGSHLLLATGRMPNTGDLGLETTGISTDERGYIAVNDRLETAVEGIWALGDCNGRGAFTHTAYNDYEIVAANLFDGARRSVEDRILCYALYIDPPLGRAGMTERQAKKAGLKFDVAKRPMSKVARAKEKGETQGFMKFLVENNTHRILGAAILGVGGDEVVHAVLDLMYRGKGYELLTRKAVHIHPTVSELIPTTLQSL